MPSWSGLFRIIRRRLVLGLIFALSLTYCAFSLLRNEKKLGNLENDLDDMDGMIVNDNNDDLMSDYDTIPEQLKVSGKPPLWQMGVGDQAAKDNLQNIDLSNLNENETNTWPCRNSIQGKVLIVDERGIVCARKEVLPNGCCSIKQKETTKSDDASSITKRERYSCKTCNVQGCCAIYEYCVSCCLNPGKQIKGRKDILLNLHRDGHKAQKDDDVVRRRLRNLDRFQVCLAACRTSSASVRHENTVYHWLQVGAHAAYKAGPVLPHVFVVQIDALHPLAHVCDYFVANLFLDGIAHVYIMGIGGRVMAGNRASTILGQIYAGAVY